MANCSRQSYARAIVTTEIIDGKVFWKHRDNEGWRQANRQPPPSTKNGAPVQVFYNHNRDCIFRLYHSRILIIVTCLLLIRVNTASGTRCSSLRDVKCRHRVRILVQTTQSWWGIQVQTTQSYLHLNEQNVSKSICKYAATYTEEKITNTSKTYSSRYGTCTKKKTFATWCMYWIFADDVSNVDLIQINKNLYRNVVG